MGANGNGAAANRLASVVLAAGQGTRMRSARAKVLHEVAGRPMISWVLAAAAPLRAERTVVVIGYQADAVRSAIGERARCAVQADQLGTGHAVLQAVPALRGFHGDVLVLYGDTPLVRTPTLRRLLSAHRRRGRDASRRLVTVLSMLVEDPTGYGRIVRGARPHELRIVEERDSTDAERPIDEVNTGIYCFDARFLVRSLRALERGNAQGEYYLTDLVAKAAAAGGAACVTLDDESEAMGVNSRLELATAEALMQQRLIAQWMERGVTFLDPSSVHLSATTTIGQDATIGPGVRLDGATVIGPECTLDGNCHLRDTRLERGVQVRWGVVADRARIGAHAIVGPYAHLRPNADLEEHVHVGNFVEVKNSRIGRRSKANHLTYIGDATVGADTNVGAGTITCNYDGFAKHRTVIGDRVQIGSDTQLVAPVKVGDGAYVAAGSTITRDVEADALAFNDKRQCERAGWAAEFRKRAARKASEG